MAKERKGYVGKDKKGKWFARLTLTTSNGNIAKRAANKLEAKQILKHSYGNPRTKTKLPSIMQD